MDRPGLGGSSRFRALLPKTVTSHLLVTVSGQHAGATFVDYHNEPLHTYSDEDSYGNNFLPNIEQHLASGWTAQLPPGSGAQVEQGGLFQNVQNIGMDPNESSYKGMVQLALGENSLAISQHTWTPFEQDKEAFSMGNTYREFNNAQEYPHFISRTMDVPLQSDQLGENSSSIVDNSPDVFGTETSSFLGQTMACGSIYPLRYINATEDLLDFSGSYAPEYWQSIHSENVEANTNTLGAPFENRPAADDIDDLPISFDTSTPANRLSPSHAAVLLGIPEEPGRNEELPFSYEAISNQNNEDNSTGVTQSPDTLQASEISRSPTLTKVSSHRSSVTLLLEQPISSYRIESRQLQSDSDEAHSNITVEETQESLDSSFKEVDLGVLQPRLRTVLPLLPPPADFSHTNIVVEAPVVQSFVVEKYLKEASEAKQQGENKLATALPAITNLSLTVPLTKRARSPGEDPIDISDHETCKIMEETESVADTLSLNALASASVFSRKKRGKLNIQQRKSTATIRELGACIRCGIFKEKCSNSVPCERCVEVARSKQTTFNIPCWRSKLGDIELFRRRTQHGLFVYTYTKQFDSLHARAVHIFDPDKLKPSSRERLPFPCQDELIIESLRPLKYLDSHLLLPRDKNGHLIQHPFTVKELEKGKVIATYLDKQMKPVLNALGTSHQFVRLTLDIAERYSRSPHRPMLRNSLRIFTARFLRRKFWVSTPDETSYDVAWMDVPWRAMPVSPPKTTAEAEALNKILKDYLYSLEKSILRDFKIKVYARNREHWFELFLVTFIFQVVLSEKLEMSFYSTVKGVDSALEMPWSTFGGLRSYSSQAIAAHFRAIKGTLPFHLPRKDRTALGKLGDLENDYLDECPKALKDSMLKKDDLGSRRSSSSGHGGTPGSWWQWAIETILDSDILD